MAESPRNKVKVAQKKLVGFTREALEELERKKKDTGQSQTQILNDAICGVTHFNPFVEEGIFRFQQMKGVSRESAIQALLSEAIARRPDEDAGHSGRAGSPKK